MNCVTYARVSTEKQADRELSIPAQQQAMREYATRQGWTILEDFVEPGVSGRSAERPVLRRLMSRCRQAPQVDVVLVHKVDRLARNVYDHATIRALLKQRKIRLASVVENVDETVTGQLVENIMASIAEFYSANLGEEVKKGMRIVVQKGGWPHVPPRGYRMDRDADGRSRPVPDEMTSALVRQAFELYATGVYSLVKLSETLATKGFTTSRGKPISNSYMQQMLENPFYVGRIRWKGQDYPGKHEPLVTEELFDRVRTVLRERKTDSGERHNKLRFFLRGVAYCGHCGSRMTAERHRRWGYYRCVRKARRASLCLSRLSNIQPIHEEVRILYKQLRIRDSLREAMRQASERDLAERTVTGKRRLRSLTMLRAKCEERQVRIAEVYASGTVSVETFKALATKLEGERKAVDAEIQRLSFNPQREREDTLSLLGSSETLWDLHTRLPASSQKHLLYVVFKQLLVKDGHVVGYELKAPLASCVWRDDGVGSSPSIESGHDLTEVSTAMISILKAHDAAENQGAAM